MSQSVIPCSSPIANLRAHGHVTLRFVEADAGEDVQPGEIVLVGAGIPRVMVGDALEIV